MWVCGVSVWTSGVWCLGVLFGRGGGGEGGVEKEADQSIGRERLLVLHLLSAEVTKISPVSTRPGTAYIPNEFCFLLLVLLRAPDSLGYARIHFRICLLSFSGSKGIHHI